MNENVKRGPEEMALEWDELNPTRKQQVQSLFDLWASLYTKGRPKLGPKRKRRIQIALDEHGYEACEAAIRGIQYSPFHMGKNRQRKQYTELSLILRDEEHIENFANLYDQHSEHEGNLSGAAMDFLND